MTVSRVRAYRIAAILLVLLLIAVAVRHFATAGGDSGSDYRYSGQTKPGTTIPLPQRKLAGDVTGKLLAGGTYDLKQDLGHPVVLNFFATWCGPCQVETPQLDSVYRADQTQGVRVVGFDVKDGSDGNLRQLLTTKRITFPVVHDNLGKTALELGNLPLAGIPHTIVVDKHGRVASVTMTALTPADLQPVLTQLTAES